MRGVLLRSLAVLGVGAAVLAGILYYASTVDSRPPAVAGFALTQHLAGDASVALTSTSLEVDFSEPVERGSAQDAFRIEPSVDGSFSWSDSTLTFTPLDPLPPASSFTAHIEPGVRDVAGNAMEQASGGFAFRTVGEPQVVASDPAAGAVDVPLDASISLTFSTLMDTRSVAAALELSPFFARDLRWSGEKLTIVPHQPLAADREYTVAVGSGARDLSGTPLREPFQLTFTTVETGLSVRSLVPADESEGIAVTTPIVVAFDRPIDPDSLQNDQLRLDPAVAGSIDLLPAPGADQSATGDRRLLRFQPSGALPPNTTFTVTLAAGLRGTDGAPLGTPVSWTFLTGAPLATLGNQVVFVSDASGVANLWAMNPDGSGQRQLSVEVAPVVDYAVAPDGRSFVVADGEQLIEQRANGSGRRVLTDEGALEFDPTYAPDGGQIAFGRVDAATGRSLGLWVRGVGGGDAHRLEMPSELLASPTPTPSASGEPETPLLRAPRYSPDGHVLAFIDVTNQRIGMLELPAARLTTAPFRAVEPPVWLPDSSGVLVDGLYLGVGGSFHAPAVSSSFDRAAAELTPTQLRSLTIGRLDRGGAVVAESQLPPGVASPSVDAEGRLAYLLLEPGSASGAAWLTRVDDGPGHSLLIAQPLDAVRFAPDPDRLLLAEARLPGASRGGISVFDVSTGSAHQIADRGWMPRWVP